MSDLETRTRSSLQPWLVAVFCLAWAGAFELFGRWIVPGGIVAFLVMVAIMATIRMMRKILPNSWSAMVGTAVIFLTSVAAFIFMTTVLGRQLVIVTSAGLLVVLLHSEEHSPVELLQGRTTLLAMVVSYWLGFVGLLGMKVFLNWPLWILCLAAGVLTLAVAGVIWSEAGVPHWKVRLPLIFSAWLGAELYLGMWALPTALFVGSAVGATVALLWIQATRHMWLNSWRPERGRRYLALGATIIVVVLLTARWI